MKQYVSTGFTLLEVLVALVVCGFLFTGLAQGVRFGLRTHDMQTATLRRQGGLEPVDRVLRQLVTDADPGTFSEPPNLVGGPNAIELMTELPIAAGSLPTRRVAAALRVDASHRLVLRWIPAPHVTLLQPPAAQATELLSNISSMEIAYWLPVDAGGGWVRTWTRRDLPALIRIRIVFPSGDPRHWPDIVAAPIRERRES